MPQYIIETSSYEHLSNLCAEAMLDCVQKKPNAVICLATGHSPRGAYREFVSRLRSTQTSIAQVTFVKLDEWLGPSMDDPVSSEDFLQREILQPLNVKAEQYISFHSQPADPQAECARIAAELERRGPIDLMILGVGQNGHIGLNESAAELTARAHIAELAPTTRSHAMLAARPVALTQGITVGVGDIFAARKVILLFTGGGKAAALAAFDQGRITTRWPVTLLHLHPHLLCIIDRNHV